MPENNDSTPSGTFHPTPGITPERTDKLMTDDALDSAGIAGNLPQREPPPQSVLASIPHPEPTLPGVEYRTLQAAPPPQDETQANRGKKKRSADDPFAWLAKRGKSDSNEK